MSTKLDQPFIPFWILHIEEQDRMKHRDLEEQPRVYPPILNDYPSDQGSDKDSKDHDSYTIISMW
jgi:hypothetical protein